MSYYKINKTILINHINKFTQLGKNDVGRIITALIQVMREELIKGNSIMFYKFGTLRIVKDGRSTKKPLFIRFQPIKKTKDYINNLTSIH